MLSSESNATPTGKLSPVLLPESVLVGAVLPPMVSAFAAAASCCAWSPVVFADDPQMTEKINVFFQHFGNLPVWFQTLWITVVAAIFGIKGTQVFRNGGPSNGKKK